MKELFNNLTAITLDLDVVTAKFADLYTILCSENSKRNLTRITDEEDFWIKHVYDSLLVAEAFPEMVRDGANIADLGCGGGFPSIVLATAFPRVNITAIDSIGKKTASVMKIADELGLQNLEVITGRGRELSAKEEFQNRFDYITARAVSEIKNIFRESRRMLKSDGKMVLFKTPTAAEKELREVRRKTAKSGFCWEMTPMYTLPDNRGDRVFVIGHKSSDK